MAAECFLRRADSAIASAGGTTRELGFWSAAALVVGHTIGVGIFLTPSQLIGSLASPGWTLGLWLAGGAILAGARPSRVSRRAIPRRAACKVYLREAGRTRRLSVWLAERADHGS